MPTPRCRRTRLLVLLLCPAALGLMLSGCGGRKIYPVEGTVYFKGETAPARELAGYKVTFQSQDQPVRVSAEGEVQPDGTFKMGTETVSDGAVLGKHRVVLTMPLEEEGKKRPRKLLPDRYVSFENSGLIVEVKPETNTIKLEVERLKR